MTKHSSQKIFIFTIIWTFSLMPSALSWTWKIRFTTASLFFLFFIATKNLKINSISLMFLGVCITTPLLSLLNEMFFWGESTVNDFKISLLSNLFFLFFSTTACSLLSKDRDNSLQLFSINNFTILGVILSLISLQQFFDLFHLNQVYIPNLAPSDSIHIKNFLTSPFPRTIGTVANPNEFGFQLTLCASASLFGFFNYIKKPFYMFSFLLSFIALCLTASRSSILMLLAITTVLYFSSKTLRLKFIFIGAILTLMISISLFLKKEGFEFKHMNRIMAIANISKDNSWNARKNLYWEFNIDWFIKSPLLGVGPLKTQSPQASDNEWLLLLRQRGIIGVTAMFLFFTSSITTRKKQYLYFSWGILLGGSLYMIPAAFISSSSLYPMWGILFFTIGGIKVKS